MKYLLSVFLVFLVVSYLDLLHCQQKKELETVKVEAVQIIAQVNEHKITHNELYQRLLRINGQQVLNQMINELLIEDEAKKQKIDVSEKELSEKFDEIKNQFVDEENFNNWLNSQGINLEEFKNQLRLTLLQDKLIVKAKNIKVTDKEINDFFEQNRDKLGTPEQIRCRHILVKTKEQADDLLVALSAGADFSVMAKAKSEDPASKDRGGDIGFFTKGMLLPEFEEVAFKLKVGEISQPVQTKLGFHIIKLEEKKPAQPAKLDKDMKKRIKNILLQNKISSELSGYLQELRQKAKIVVY